MRYNYKSNDYRINFNKGHCMILDKNTFAYHLYWCNRIYYLNYNNDFRLNVIEKLLNNYKYSRFPNLE